MQSLQITGKASTLTQHWVTCAVEELIEHIVVEFHEPLRRDLPRLEQLAFRVVRAHHARNPALRDLLESFLALRRELEPHMLKEENVLFPRMLEGLPVHAPIGRMELEHHNATSLLARMRRLSANYVLPEEACASYRALYDELPAFEASLIEHMHLESHVLFPRFAAGRTGG